MKGMLTVLIFTFRAQARKRSYIISTAIIAVLIIAALCVPDIINAVQNSKNTNNAQSKAQNTFYIIDSTRILADNPVLTTALTGYKVVFAAQPEKNKLIKKIGNSSKVSLAVVSVKSGAIFFDYYIHEAGDGPDPDLLSSLFKNIYSAQLLSSSGVPSNIITSVLSNATYNLHQSGKNTFSGYIPALIVSILLFMSIYMYGYWVAVSIASEKSSRVMELLITSTKPSKIVIGKGLAMGFLGLLQLIFIIFVSVAAYKLVYPKNFNLDGLTINFSGFTPFLAIVLIVYFLLGFALYSMVSALAGATVSNSEDVRTAIMPVSIVAVISFYFAYGTIMLPDSTAALTASLIPFSSPFSMPSRILMASIPIWQIILSLLLLAVTTALMTWISIRLYSSAVLHYGRKLKLSELILLSRKTR